MFIAKIPLTRKDIKRITNNMLNPLQISKPSETITNNNNIVNQFNFEWSNPVNELEYVCCWNCAYKVLYKESIGIPVDIIKQSFRCYGYFCSWECAVRYLYDKYFISNPHDYYNQYSLLCIAYQKINNCTKCTINKAPPKEVLKEFGGTIDYNDYRNNKRNIDFYKLPLVPLNIYIMNMSKIQ